MKYKVSMIFSFIVDEQEYYNSLIEEGFLPDEAEKHIKDFFHEQFGRIETRADNVLCWPYTSECIIEEVEEENN